MATNTLAPAVPSSLPTLRPYQVESARAIVDSVRRGLGLAFTVVMARQAGKNELSAQLELFLLLANGHRDADAIKCAPTFDPQAKISIRRLWQRIADADLADIADRQGQNIIALGRARLIFLSAEPGANVVGHTASLLLEVDEAQDVDREKFDREFRPMAAPSNATTVYYGTPWDDTTLLEQAVQANLELQRRDGLRRHFQYDWTVVAQHNPAYARFVEAERQRLGENHPLFLTQYALKAVSGGGHLFSPAQRAQLQGDHPRRHAPTPGEAYVAGLDLAGQDLEAAHPEPAWPAGRPVEGPAHGSTKLTMSGGRDASVLTIARLLFPPSDAVVQEPRLEVVEHLAWVGEPHEALLARLADLLRNVWHVRRLAVDATGLGETLARLLDRALGPSVVVPIRFTAEVKSRLGYGLLAAVNGGRLKLYAADGSPEYVAFWREAELARVIYRPNRTMNFFVEASQGHDDYLVSLTLTVEAASGLAPRTARGRTRPDADARSGRAYAREE